MEKLEPYQQRTPGCLCGAGAGMNLAEGECMAFPVEASSCQHTMSLLPHMSRACAGL